MLRSTSPIATGSIMATCLLGRGNTPFGEYMAAIRDAGFAGAASVELEFPPDSNQMRDWVAEAYTSTLKEMKAVGVH